MIHAQCKALQLVHRGEIFERRELVAVKAKLDQILEQDDTSECGESVVAQVEAKYLICSAFYAADDVVL